MDHLFAQIAEDIDRKADARREAERRAHCPLADRIIANNLPPAMDGGMMGGLQAISAAIDQRAYKRRAAAAIISLRHNREALLLQGRDPRGGFEYWFARAQDNRREAARLGGRS